MCAERGCTLQNPSTPSSNNQVLALRAPDTCSMQAHATLSNAISPHPPAHSVCRCITALQHRRIRHPQLCAVWHSCNAPLVDSFCCLQPRNTAAASGVVYTTICSCSGCGGCSVPRRCLVPAAAAASSAATVSPLCFRVLLPVAIAQGKAGEECVVCCS